MHLSLKGSMDRQPLTDRLGDRLLAEYGGAAAAYSLRALNGNGDSVVRVRRASDNDEEDFTAEQIELGEMVNWVNSQIVPPLDIGVETSEGRIPVPEGGTSIGIPAAAYSLRNLSTTYTGNVVDVRRSSNNAEESFTAAEVADGTLTDWVNTNFNVKTYDFSSGAGGLAFTSNMTLEGGESIAGVDDALKMSVVSTGGNDVHRCYQNLSALGSGSSLRITFKAYRPSSNVNSGKLGFSFASGFLSSNIEEQFFSADDTWEDFTFDANSGNTTRFYVQLSSTDGIGSLKSIFNGTTGDHVYIKDLKIDVVNSSGFVSKWYDQSGNDNHATQGTDASQPKIVDGGSLVTGGLEFDGVDDLLIGTHNVTSAYNFFSVTTDEGSATSYIADTGSGSTNGVNYGRTVNSGGNRQLTLNHGGVSAINATGFLVGTELISQSYDGTTINAFVDGSLVGTSVQGYIASGTVLSLGASGSAGAFLNGKMQELIIYTSDQSANRTAIEANIGETYGITGIPAYDNTVDGFVETWYDQSGNGNDATQSVAASQPKIVAGGTLATKLGQPSINFTTDSAVLLSDSFSITETESAVFAIWQPAKDSATTVQARHRTLFGNVSSEIYIGTPNSDSQMSFKRFGAVKTFTLGLDSLNTPNLHAFVGTTAGVDYYFNGSSIYSDTATGTNSIRNHLRIGSKQNLATHDTEGYISELIIYDSDQSANRSGIETNINAHYNIYP
jgi:hypothetical protein